MWTQYKYFHLESRRGKEIPSIFWFQVWDALSFDLSNNLLSVHESGFNGWISDIAS